MARGTKRISHSGKFVYSGFPLLLLFPFSRQLQPSALPGLIRRLRVPDLKIISHISVSGCNGMKSFLPRTSKRRLRPNQGSTGFLRRLGKSCSIACNRSKECPRDSASGRWIASRLWSTSLRKGASKYAPSLQDFHSLAEDRRWIVKRRFAICGNTHPNSVRRW